MQRTKEARRCQENRRLGRGWEEAERLVWRLQEPWARLRLERQRELRVREAGERLTRRQRLTRRLVRTVTTRGGEGEITSTSSRKHMNMARWDKFLKIRLMSHSYIYVVITLAALLSEFCSRSW